MHYCTADQVNKQLCVIREKGGRSLCENEKISWQQSAEDVDNVGDIHVKKYRATNSYY